jgi:hypothetical protein
MYIGLFVDPGKDLFLFKVFLFQIIVRVFQNCSINRLFSLHVFKGAPMKKPIGHCIKDIILRERLRDVHAEQSSEDIVSETVNEVLALN